MTSTRKLMANQDRTKHRTKTTYCRSNWSKGRWKKKHSRGESQAAQPSTMTMFCVYIKFSHVKSLLIRLIECFKLDLC